MSFLKLDDQLVMNKYAKVAVQSTTTEQAQQRQRIRNSTKSPLNIYSPLFSQETPRQQVPAQKTLKDAKPE